MAKVMAVDFINFNDFLDNGFIKFIATLSFIFLFNNKIFLS